MCYFNTSGPCNPEEHFTVMREGLVAQGKQLVERGRYFTFQKGKRQLADYLASGLLKPRSDEIK